MITECNWNDGFKQFSEPSMLEVGMLVKFNNNVINYYNSMLKK